MQETAESVKEYGVLVPALARPREDGGYELIAGHRRKHACELAGLTTMPVIVRNIDRDAATIIMVDSNLQRENILPSERAKAYKMKMEAIKRQGARTDLTSPKISAKFRSDDEVGQDAGVSGDTIRNYIALTQLVPELQQMVDEKKIALSPAYQIAALTPKEQGLLLETIDSEQATPSLSQAQRMKKLSQSGELNEDTMLSIMMEQKKPEKNDIIAKAPMAEWSLTRRPLPLCSLSSSLPPRGSTPPPSRESCSAEASPRPASTKRREAITPTIFPAVTGFGVHPLFSAFWRTNATPACM